MKRKKIMLCLLVVVLTMSMLGCSSKNPMEGGNTEGIGEDAGEQKDVVIRVGEKTVGKDEIMFYVLCVKEQYEGYFGQDIWSVDFGNGRTFEDMCKEDILNEIVQLKIITTMAEAEGVVVTEDEADEIADTVREQLEEISDLDILLYHLDTELLESIYHDNYLSSKMFDVVTSDVDTMVPDEEARCAEYQVLTLLTEGTDKNFNQIAQTPEEREETRAKAQELYVQAVTEGTDFLLLATVHSDLEEVSVILGRGEWPEEYDREVFDQAAFALRTGETSLVIEGTHGFYIIHCVNEMEEDATAQAKEAIISARQDEAFQKLYAQWATDFQVIVDEEKWDAITFGDENQTGPTGQME